MANVQSVVEAPVSLNGKSSQEANITPFPFLFQETPYLPSVKLLDPYSANTTFPLAVTPERTDFSINELVSATKAATSSGAVRDLLTKHGAIYSPKR